MFEFIKNHPLPSAALAFIILFCCIGIPLILQALNKSKTSNAPSFTSDADIIVDDKPMNIQVKEKVELNNISTVSKIKLVNCKITLYKDINFTGEKEEYKHAFLVRSGEVHFIKEFDGTNKMFKSLIIEPNASLK